jgi:hypothetical protein
MSVAEKQPKVSSGRGGARPGAGRPKGSLDKGNAALREMILNALAQAGGQEYLAGVAASSPAAFLSLLGKVLPTTLASDPNAPFALRIERVIVDPKANA